MEIGFLHLLTCSKLRWKERMDYLFTKDFGQGLQDMPDNVFCYTMRFVAFFKTSRAHPPPHIIILWKPKLHRDICWFHCF